MNIFKFSVGSEAKRVAVRCVFAIGVVCWANLFICLSIYLLIYLFISLCKLPVQDDKLQKICCDL